MPALWPLGKAIPYLQVGFAGGDDAADGAEVGGS